MSQVGTVFDFEYITMFSGYWIAVKRNLLEDRLRKGPIPDIVAHQIENIWILVPNTFCILLDKNSTLGPG